MPFLNAVKASYTNRKIECAKRNGLRHAIFTPQNKYTCQSYYIGQWRNDTKEGRGRGSNRKGWTYDGSWYNNKRHGCGVLYKLSREDHTVRCYYRGEWLAGKRQGFGHGWFKDGAYYEGAFCRNKRHGYGCMWYCNGDYYEGDWENDLHHGLGILVKGNGNKYEGLFVRGKKEGSGVFYHTITGQEQHGLWKNDFFINGTMSDGDFRQSARYPTAYPIPPMELVMPDENSENADDIVDGNSDAEVTPVEHFCKRRRKRIIPNFCVSVNTCPCLESISLTSNRIS